MEKQALSAAIDAKVGEVRSEALDISYGELLSLHANREVVIHPDYQRLFRWSDEQRSRLVESILLELPIPQIFLIENDDGVLELIDGLQRTSSVIQFIDASKLEDLEPLILTGCDLVPELNECSFADLPLVLQLKLKRSSVRAVIIKRQSRSFLRYEMFKRLNTGGDSLSPQEIRNCSSRMVGEKGIRFYAFLQECAQSACFLSTTETLSQGDLEKKGDEELVLRYLALKNGRHLFRGSVRDWLDAYMEQVLLGESQFAYEEEKARFVEIFSYLERTMGRGAFVKYRDGQPIGALAPAYFEAVTMGVLSLLPRLDTVAAETVRQSIICAVQSQAFREDTGPGANSRTKLDGRIETICRAIEVTIRA